jgi:hypothetical protein
MNSLSIPSVYSRGDSNSPVKIKLFHKLRGTYFGIREQFPAEVEEKRRTLYPVVHDCKQKGLRTKLVRDRLFIENIFTSLILLDSSP